MKFFENETVLKYILNTKVHKWLDDKNYNEELDWYFKENWSYIDKNYKSWPNEEELDYSFLEYHLNFKNIETIFPLLIELVIDNEKEKEKLLIDMAIYNLLPYHKNHKKQFQFIGYKKTNDWDSLNLVVENKKTKEKFYINKNNDPDFRWNDFKSISHPIIIDKEILTFNSDDNFYIYPKWLNKVIDDFDLGINNPLFVKLEKKGYINLPTEDEVNLHINKIKENGKLDYLYDFDLFHHKQRIKKFLVLKRSIEAIKEYYLIQSFVKQYHKEFDLKINIYKELQKNISIQDSVNLTKFNSFSKNFNKVGTDPGYDLEVVDWLEKEFNKIIPFLLKKHTEKLTLWFKKTNIPNLKSIYFPLEKNITINTDLNKIQDVLNYQSFMKEYAQFVDYEIGLSKTKVNELILPFSLSDPEFLKIHSKYVDKFNEIHRKNIDLIDKKEYLTSHTEVFARGFERYLIEIGFENTLFNPSIEYLDSIQEDVFNELDKVDRDKLFEMYEGIFKIKEKMIDNDLEKFENINLFESLEENKEKEKGKQLSLFDDSFVSDEKIEVINEGINNNLEDNKEEKIIDRSNWGVSLFKVYGYKENLDEKFAEYNLGNPFGVVPLSKKGKEVAFGVICNATSLKKSNINNLIYLEKPNNIFAIPLDYIFTMDQNSFKDETFYKKSFNEKLNVDDKFKHKTMNQLVKSFINENTKVHNLDVIQKDIDNDKKLNEGRER
ncbi:hypothetical protein RRG58_07875 [Mycoplasmopsis cynos]|nr:hypothetical protein [Mycoplasmopsis felis]WQQ11301.1 hypothetical protein RRG50_02520 [Mycoplasmopsis felis]WQQ11352.1 hypothetical protein RRG50_02785 [Mycoplasmopsis felis]WQQ11478.1 hypothetical protein RRG50_03455 [Mycoplasmopsis felis]WQQ11584.1 hypothetical protein RRG50_04060 [Mycoplasmopsis felis]